MNTMLFGRGQYAEVTEFRRTSRGGPNTWTSFAAMGCNPSGCPGTLTWPVEEKEEEEEEEETERERERERDVYMKIYTYIHTHVNLWVWIGVARFLKAVRAFTQQS